MQAIILAAGIGRRLGHLTKHQTKCMIEVNGKSLIDRAIEQLSTLPLNRIIIVCGYKNKVLKEHLQCKYHSLCIEYIYNPQYRTTNNIYSMFLAQKEMLKDDITLLLESDIIFENEILKKIVSNPFPNLAIVDKYQQWMNGTAVVLEEDNKIRDFITDNNSKLINTNHYYKTVNIYKFSCNFIKKQFLPFLNAYIQAFGYDHYYEDVLRIMTSLKVNDLRALSLNGEKWYEIDDIQDLEVAEMIFTEKKNKLKNLQERFGGYWRFQSVLDFCYLSNPFFPSQNMMEEIKEKIDVLARNYPSNIQINNSLMALFHGIKSENICVGNGVSELIQCLAKYFTGKIGIILPTFEEYYNQFKIENIISYIPENNDFSYTTEDIKSYFLNKNISVLLLINPDNPSGNFLRKFGTLSLLDWCSKKNIHLIVDESFIDFVNEDIAFSLINNDILNKYPFLIVLKSISKSYGVPGLRLGLLASADHHVVAFVRKKIPIWNINSVAEYFIQIIGKYKADYVESCKKIQHERNIFFNELSCLPFLRVIPSHSNYFMCEVTDDKLTATELAELLISDFNILIKDCSGKKGVNGKNFIRVAIKKKDDNKMLMSAMIGLYNRI